MFRSKYRFGVDLNSVHVSGRLAADPQYKSTPGKRPVAWFRLAVNRDRDHGDFFKVVVFDRQAELVSKHLRRGRSVIVSGRLAQAFEDGDELEIICTELLFNDAPNRERDGRETRVAERRGSSEATETPLETDSSDGEDDLHT